MASNEYLEKIRFSLRRNPNSKVDEEILDVIEQCQEDLIRMGVPQNIARSEENKLVLGCQRAFARWQFGMNSEEAEKNHENYQIMADELRKSC